MKVKSVALFLAGILAAIASAITILSYIGVQGPDIGRWHPIRSIVWKSHELDLVGRTTNGGRFHSLSGHECFGPAGRRKGEPPSLALGDGQPERYSIVQCASGATGEPNANRRYEQGYEFSVKLPRNAKDPKIDGFIGRLGIDQQDADVARGFVRWTVKYGSRSHPRVLCRTSVRNDKVAACHQRTLNAVRNGHVVVTQVAKPLHAGMMFAGVEDPRLAWRERRLPTWVWLAALVVLFAGAVIFARRGVRAVRKTRDRDTRS